MHDLVQRAGPAREDRETHPNAVAADGPGGLLDRRTIGESVSEGLGCREAQVVCVGTAAGGAGTESAEAPGGAELVGYFQGGTQRRALGLGDELCPT